MPGTAGNTHHADDDATFTYGNIVADVNMVVDFATGRIRTVSGVELLIVAMSRRPQSVTPLSA